MQQVIFLIVAAVIGLVVFRLRSAAAGERKAVMARIADEREARGDYSPTAELFREAGVAVGSGSVAPPFVPTFERLSDLRDDEGGARTDGGPTAGEATDLLGDLGIAPLDLSPADAPLLGADDLLDTPLFDTDDSADAAPEADEADAIDAIDAFDPVDEAGEPGEIDEPTSLTEDADLAEWGLDASWDEVASAEPQQDDAAAELDAELDAELAEPEPELESAAELDAPETELVDEPVPATEASDDPTIDVHEAVEAVTVPEAVEPIEAIEAVEAIEAGSVPAAVEATPEAARTGADLARALLDNASLDDEPAHAPAPAARVTVAASTADELDDLPAPVGPPVGDLRTLYRGLQMPAGLKPLGPLEPTQATFVTGAVPPVVRAALADEFDRLGCRTEWAEADVARTERNGQRGLVMIHPNAETARDLEGRLLFAGVAPGSVVVRMLAL